MGRVDREPRDGGLVGGARRAAWRGRGGVDVAGAAPDLASWWVGVARDAWAGAVAAQAERLTRRLPPLPGGGVFR